MEDEYRLLYQELPKKNRNSSTSLRRLQNEKKVMHGNKFLLGFWLGISVVQLLLIILLWWYVGPVLDPDHDPEFSTIFPDFRGPFLIILYLWLRILNIWGWIKVHVNYRLVLQYGDHQTSLTEVRPKVFQLT